MRHFDHLTEAAVTDLFESAPQPFGRDSPSERLAVALGATLYLPADRPSLPEDVRKRAAEGVTSAVICLEDAIPDDAVAAAESHLVDSVRRLHSDPGEVEPPLLFVRVREPAQMPRIARRLGPAAVRLTGFVLPKFTARVSGACFAALEQARREAGRPLLVMPVLESAAVLHAESRIGELLRLRAVLDRYRSATLAVRIGATDLCGLYGLRRSPELSVYDVKVVADLIADVVNVLGRADGTGFPLSGPVWEYFGGPDRVFKPQLRQTPFERHDDVALRGTIVSSAVDGLIREVQLDMANGLTGKTIIHPTHAPVVHAMSVVSSEEYRDARDVLAATDRGGVRASVRRNKMNEARPHTAWARITTRRAAVFGVGRDGVTFADLLAASVPW